MATKAPGYVGTRRQLPKCSCTLGRDPDLRTLTVAVVLGNLIDISLSTKLQRDDN